MISQLILAVLLLSFGSSASQNSFTRAVWKSCNTAGQCYEIQAARGGLSDFLPVQFANKVTLKLLSRHGSELRVTDRISAENAQWSNGANRWVFFKAKKNGLLGNADFEFDGDSMKLTPLL